MVFDVKESGFKVLGSSATVAAKVDFEIFSSVLMWILGSGCCREYRGEPCRGG